MREVDHQLQELYLKYKADKSQLHPPQHRTSPVVDRISRLFRRQSKDPHRQRRAALEQMKREIANILENVPGKYPLTELRYLSQITGTGFNFGFEYNIEDEVFKVDYWSNDRWGILVQQHPNDYVPQIEVAEKTIQPSGEDLEEDPEAAAYTQLERIIHLPEGFTIPVGPIYYASDSVPLTEEEISADRAKALKLAKTIGVSTDKKTLELANLFHQPTRRYSARYFYWQPIISEKPTRISIDFDAIEPYHMGLSFENAPTFNNTIVIKDEDLFFYYE